MKYLLLLIFLGCANTLTVKDFTFCAIAPSEQGAECDGFLTNHATSLDESEWIALSNTGWIALSPDDYSNLKTEITQACTELKCTYEQTSAINNLFQKVKAAELKAKSK